MVALGVTDLCCIETFIQKHANVNIKRWP